MISPIEQIGALGGVQQTNAASGAASAEGGMFESVFRSAIENVKETDAEVVELEYMMATGQLDNPALLTIAQTKSTIAVDMLVQMRNKAMEAYSELNRISL